MMTLNEREMFAAGVFWGIFIIKPLWDIAVKIVSEVWKNSR